MRAKPPRLSEALLRLTLAEEDAETIAGDLEEMFGPIAERHGGPAAAWWHWRQVFSITIARLLNRDEEPAHAPGGRTTMSALRQDLGYATRSLRKQPMLTAMVVIMLALGIGANVAIFSLIHAVLLKPLPFSEPDRLMLVHTLIPQRDAPGTHRPGVWSYPKYQVLQHHQRVFESTALFRPGTWNLTGTGTPERLAGELVDVSYFDVLGVAAQTGRTFTADEARAPGSAPLVLLGHGFWSRSFGADPAMVGRTMGLNGTAHTIVGVLPRGFRGLSGEADVWVPLMTLPADDLGGAQSHSYTLVARRKADVSAEQAQAAARVLGDVVDRQYPDSFAAAFGRWGAMAVPLHDARTDPIIRRSMFIMLGAVAALLAIVCTNLANLMFARALARQREVGIRLALGASRVRIVRQLMTESVLLASAGAAAGLLVAYGLLSAGAALLPDLQMVVPGSRSTVGLTRVGLGELGADASVMIYTGAVALGAALFFGLIPAVRTARRDLTTAIKVDSSGSLAHGTRALGLRSLLVVGQVALALVLLTSGGLMVKSVLRLRAVELGFNPSALLTARVALPPPQYEPARAAQVLERLLARLAAWPEIESVAFGNCAPVSGGCNTTLATFPGRPPVPRGTEPLVGAFWASPDYFRTLGIPLVRGRVFTDRDRIGQPKVVVINETAARRLWGGEDPIGRRIGVGMGGFREGAEVVGVVGDLRYGAIDTSVGADVYLPLLQSPRSFGLIYVRSRAAHSTLVPVLRRELQALDPDVPLIDIRTMDERLGDATWRTRMSAWLLALFAGIGLLVAAVGVYAAMSQAVEQRMREIGVRIALGAARQDILRLILGRVFAVGVIGIAVGVLLAWPLTRYLTELLYQVNPGDPVVVGTLATVLLAVALAAGYVPARRATRVDPLTTLRAE